VGESKGLKTFIRTVHSLSSDDIAKWQRLADRSLEPNPFHEPSCLVPAAQHLSHGNEIEMAVASEGGEWVAALPLRNVPSWQRFRYPFVTTAVRRYPYCGNPLLDPDRGTDGLADIFRTAAKRSTVTQGRVMVLQELVEGGATEAVVQDVAGRLGWPLQRFQSFERPFFHRREGTAADAGHASIHRHNLRRLRRRLGEAAGGEVKLVDRSEDPQAIEELIQMEAISYKAQQKIALTNFPGEPEYFREMCDRFREMGRLHLLALQINDLVVAIMMFVESGRGLFGVKLGYLAEYGRYSPGILLHLDSIERFNSGIGLDWIDVCTYEGNDTLLRMYPDRIRYTSFFLPLGTNVADRTAVKALVTWRPAYVKLKADLRTRAADTVKWTKEKAGEVQSGRRQASE
jgi:CelD/BcsL family acetyltransferase involved in cellulose biosynthesis